MFRSVRVWAWSYLTLCNSMGCSPPGSSKHGIFLAGILEWVVISYSRGSSQPRDWSHIPYVLYIAGGSLPTEYIKVQFSSVQLLNCVRLFATPWTAAHQASLSITNSQSLLKLMSIESIMLSNHFILCWPLLLLPSIFASIRVFSNELAPHTRWTKY